MHSIIQENNAGYIVAISLPPAQTEALEWFITIGELVYRYWPCVVGKTTIGKNRCGMFFFHKIKNR